METALYQANLERIKKTICFEKTDRPPVAPSASSFCAQVAGVKISDYCAAGPGTADINVRAWSKLPILIDAVHGVSYSPYGLSLLWMSKVKVPGVDLPEDELWQVHEEELMEIDDYQKIIEGGFYNWQIEFLKTKLDDPAAKLAPLALASGESLEKHKRAGLVDLGSQTIATGFEILCGARSMPAFMRDLVKRPDLVRAALEVADAEILARRREIIRQNPPVGVWIGGWRSASELISPKIWQKMVWPAFKNMAEMLIEEGVVPVYHLDSNWIRDLDFFKDLPKHKAIMALDGATDIHKARKIMDGHTAILGDVNAAMLAFGQPKEVREYTKNLIKEFGGRGYFVAVGCDMPYNAKIENVIAMIEAAHD